jgi:hypothetical protein
MINVLKRSQIIGIRTEIPVTYPAMLPLNGCAASKAFQDGASCRRKRAEIQRSFSRINAWYITAWYNCFLAVLLITFGLYVDLSMEDCLWNGMRDALSIPAKEISNESGLKPNSGEVSTLKKRIRNELYWPLLVLEITLAVGLSFATVGSYWLVDRILGCVHQIGLDGLRARHQVEEPLTSATPILSTPTNVDVYHVKMQRLMFYLGWLTAARVERLCALSKELDEAFEAQKCSFRKNPRARW